METFIVSPNQEFLYKFSSDSEGRRMKKSPYKNSVTGSIYLVRNFTKPG